MTIETFATVEVFDLGLQALQDKVDELNKRAERHGMNMLAVTVVRTKQFFPVYKGGFGHAQDLHCVEITGTAPRINGWKLAARIEFNATIGNVVRIAPGTDDDGSFEQYRTVGPVCEHCNSARRRNDVFVLEHEDGYRKIVGRNCLADFLRCDGADKFARLAEYADVVRDWASRAECGDYEGMGCGGLRVRTMSLERYLPVVAMLMRRIGWVSRTAAKERDDCSSTADLAWTYFFNSHPTTKRWIENNELFADSKDAELAVRAIEWARTVDDTGNEYKNTIKRIAESGLVDFKGLDGYAASIIIAYKKACEFEAERTEKAKNAKTKVWFGSEGNRERGVSVICKGLHTFDGYYGTTTIVRFEHSVSDTETAVLVWFASGDKERNWEEGEEYTIDATIKGHDDDDKYGKQTKINRVTNKTA